MIVWIITVDYFIQLSSQNVVELLKGSVRILVYNSQLVRMKNEELFGCSFIKTLLRKELNSQLCVFSKSTSLQFGLIFSIDVCQSKARQRGCNTKSLETASILTVNAG